MIITYTSSKAISTIPKSSYGCTTAKRFSSSFRGNSINVTPKRKTYKKLPKVPSTEFMSPGKLFKDCLYSGYRPLPLTPPPVFPRWAPKSCSNKATNQTGYFPPSSSYKNEIITFCPPNNKSSKAVVRSLIPQNSESSHTRPNSNNFWSASATGVERYPEMDKVPRSILDNLKPFQEPEMPVEVNITTGREVKQTNISECKIKSTTLDLNMEMNADIDHERKKKKVIEEDNDNIKQ